ncbi:MAG TPA: L-histidine N(alpha)-methyltransferase [Candidatus Acidoferrales bacterium]|jgi:L-histidine N-alpha-methyltransferase|nr:L-histidine N(alpha)-methyltransferase [Candidatus Acidoferrales bacterium]
MSAIANVAVHSSQFPEQIRRDLLESLRSRKIAHKFHYDSVKQTQKWLALHQQYSPSRADQNCRDIYERSFELAAKSINSEKLHLIGLGCGGGQKDSRLLTVLKRRATDLFYTPCDVASAMVLTARHSALAVLPEKRISPFACDLQTATDLPSALNLPHFRRIRRIITFFGMIPNFEPNDILPKLASLLRPNDVLLFSANLAPGTDYAAGLKRILPQYDNALTRDWLLTFLLDLGISTGDGALLFKVEDAPGDLKRIVVSFRFKRPRQIKLDDEPFAFKTGESVRLFFSYRYTPDRIRTSLAAHNLEIQEEWIAESGEEGVFLCSRNTEK